MTSQCPGRREQHCVSDRKIVSKQQATRIQRVKVRLFRGLSNRSETPPLMELGCAQQDHHVLSLSIWSLRISRKRILESLVPKDDKNLPLKKRLMGGETRRQHKIAIHRSILLTQETHPPNKAIILAQEGTNPCKIRIMNHLAVLETQAFSARKGVRSLKPKNISLPTKERIIDWRKRTIGA